MIGESLSIETQWQSQRERRKRLINIMLIAFIVFLLTLVAVWFWLTQPLFFTSTPNPAHIVNPSRLEVHVRKLALDFSPRDEQHPENLDRVAAYIKSEFQQAGAVVSEQAYRVESRSFRNVIAQVGPDSADRIVIGAHYDSAGPLPGADDNASGVAGLIELAYLLRKQSLNTRVELVAFSLEEPPLFRTTGMGSSVHAQSLRKQNVKVKAMVCLEMIGYFSDAASSQQFPSALLEAFYPSRGNFIAVVGRFREGLLVRRVKSAMRTASPLPVYSISAPSIIPGIDFSDQLNYWHAGYNAVMITDTAFYRNNNYHTTGDTPDKLDYKRMAMVVEGTFAAVLKLAND